MGVKQRSRKTWAQFAIAVVIAGIIGVVIFGLIIGLVINLKGEKQSAEEMARQQQEELENKIKNLSKQLNEKPPEVILKQVQAKVVLKAGEPITEDMLELVELKSGEKTVVGSYHLLSSAVGKIPALKIFPGEVITKKKVLDTENMLPVEQGKRAITFNVNPSSLVDGSVVEGSRVDILSTFSGEGKNTNDRTRTVLQNIRVLKVNNPALATSSPKSLARSSSGLKSLLTLEVTPEQAERLVLAKETTSLHLVLRRFGDMDSSRSLGVDQVQLSTGDYGTHLPNRDVSSISSAKSLMQKYGEGLSNLPGVEASGSNTFKMEIYKGASNETQEFQAL